MILTVTIVRLDFEGLLLSDLDEYKEKSIERICTPDVFYIS